MTKPEPESTLNFESALQSLQQIVSELESGSTSLDSSLTRFEEGIGLLRRCYQYLDRAEQRIEQLVSLDEHGNCTLVPFDATATPEKQARGAPKPGARKTSGVKEEGSKAVSSPTQEGDSESTTLDTRDDKRLF